ncbi:MAG: hypothetical protein A7315_05605 [Candidatus Altiarchaeales archaeon WOR_SM1_79]|nr:MAG: hypothetical protein A7315_05605 [Candidatus Altiarchaeales archaeon WOR_SM1_79]
MESNEIKKPIEVEDEAESKPADGEGQTSSQVSTEDEPKITGEKEKVEIPQIRSNLLKERLQYSLATAGILFGLAVFMFHHFFIAPGIEPPFGVGSPTALLHAFIVSMFVVVILFAFHILLSGLLIADILTDTWRKNIEIVANDLFKMGFLYSVFFTIVLLGPLFILHVITMILLVLFPYFNIQVYSVISSLLWIIAFCFSSIILLLLVNYFVTKIKYFNKTPALGRIELVIRVILLMSPMLLILIFIPEYLSDYMQDYDVTLDKIVYTSGVDEYVIITIKGPKDICRPQVSYPYGCRCSPRVWVEKPDGGKQMLRFDEISNGTYIATFDLTNATDGKYTVHIEDFGKFQTSKSFLVVS